MSEFIKNISPGDFLVPTSNEKCFYLILGVVKEDQRLIYTFYANGVFLTRKITGVDPDMSFLSAQWRRL